MRCAMTLGRSRLRREFIALAAQHFAQQLVVLDDAVVHRSASSSQGEDRVGVVRDRGAVRGPAGVRDTRHAVQTRVAHLGVEVGHARHAARAPRLSPWRKYGHAASNRSRDIRGDAVLRPAQKRCYYCAAAPSNSPHMVFPSFQDLIVGAWQPATVAALRRMRSQAFFFTGRAWPLLLTCVFHRSAPARLRLRPSAPSCPPRNRLSAPDAHRRDELRVGADEHVALRHHGCAMLVRAVVVARDRARADILRARRHPRLADVGKVIRPLRSLPEHRVLHFDEIADMHGLAERSRPGAAAHADPEHHMRARRAAPRCA